MVPRLRQIGPNAAPPQVQGFGSAHLGTGRPTKSKLGRPVFNTTGTLGKPGTPFFWLLNFKPDMEWPCPATDPVVRQDFYPHYGFRTIIRCSHEDEAWDKTLNRAGWKRVQPSRDEDILFINALTACNNMKVRSKPDKNDRFYVNICVEKG